MRFRKQKQVAISHSTQLFVTFITQLCTGNEEFANNVQGGSKGGATGAMAPPRFGWAMGHTHGTHPWPHLVLEAGPHLGQKPYYLPDLNSLCSFEISIKLQHSNDFTKKMTN